MDKLFGAERPSAMAVSFFRNADADKAMVKDAATNRGLTCVDGIFRTTTS